MKARLAVVTSHPIQYQAPWFRMLARHPDVDLTVFFCSRHGVDSSYDPGFDATFAWSEPLTSGYPHEFIPSVRSNESLTFWSLTNPQLWSRLRSGDFDAVMPVGWGFASCWLSMAAARSAGVKILLRAESHEGAYGGRSEVKRQVRRRVLGELFRHVDAFLTIGSLNTAFYRSFGIADHRLFLTPYAVDNAFFLEHASRLAPRRADLREKLGVSDDRPIVVASGKLIERKAPMDLVRAFGRVRPRHSAKLVFLGDGPLRHEVTEAARREGILEDVVITGFRQQAEMCEVFAAADLFVFPSHFETWGLVLNESMLFGLPPVCSDGVSAHHDLIIPGETGDVYAAGDVDALSDVLEARLGDASTRRRMGEAARERVLSWNLERCVDGVVRALHAVASQRDSLHEPAIRSRAGG